MAMLIPTINSCLPRMTNGEKRFARLLEAKLEEDYLCWYDVAIGNKTLILILLFSILIAAY